MKIVFIPGWSTKGTDKRFDFLEKIGFEICRIDFGFQKDSSMLAGYTLKQCIYDVERELDRNTIILAKSFGAMIALMSKKKVKAKLLLAPDIKLVDKKVVDAFKLLETPFSEIINKQIGLNDVFIKEINDNIAIFYGTEDTELDISDINYLNGIIKNSKIIAIKGATHSFKTEEEQKTLVQKIKECI